jgi:hypothetical protein
MKTCETCGFRSPNGKTCLIFQTEMQYCSKHEENPEKCSICGNLMIKNTSIYDSDKEIVICQNCNQMMKTCRFCLNQYCAFEQDPNPMPKVVVQTIQQGNMTMQMQIRNPEREKMFCLTCNCYLEEFGCMRQLNQGCEKQQKP